MSTVQTEDKTVDPHVLEEWTNKLRAATDVCEKVKQDMDKLKEVYTYNISEMFVNLMFVQDERKIMCT